MSVVEVRLFACRNDNYGFLLHDPVSRRTACIDTPCADTIIAEARAQEWSVTDIWNTHWHDDHAGGNAALQGYYDCHVFAPAEVRDKVGAKVDRIVEGGDRINFGDICVDVIATPGHTLGHVAFHLASERLVFVGDTLFALGCGRMFEGNPRQMWNSLLRLRALPVDTRIFCAHEYTRANAAFALSVDPDNAALADYCVRIDRLRAADKPTIPTNMATELATNPFLRADAPELQSAMGTPGDAVATFAALRRRKDDF